MRPALLVAAGIAVSAMIGLAGAHWHDGEGLATAAEPMERPAPQPSAKAAEVCDDPAASFLNANCSSNKHAKHGGRTARRVANVTLGRTDIPPDRAAMALTRSATPATAPEVEPAEKPSMTPAPERTAAAKKPKAKSRAPLSLAAQARALDRQTGMDAFAQAPRFGFANPYVPRPPAPPWGFDGSFGRSW